MKILLRLNVMVVVLLIVVGCTSQQKKNKESDWLLYSNDFFSIEYPPNWEYKEEIRDMGEPLNDTLSWSKGVRVTIYNPSSMAQNEYVLVQKSAFGEKFLQIIQIDSDAPEYWRDMSLMLKDYDDDYIGYDANYLLDSIAFKGYPAAMAVFFYRFEDEVDTMVQVQTVVMKDKKELYYLNNQFALWNDKQQRLGDAILGTIKFKDNSDNND